MIFPQTTNQIRPNRITEKKDEKYHLDYARWAIGVQNTTAYRNFITKTIINWNFYQNNQWIFDEDLTHFFLDESGEARHRIKISRNLIRRVVEFYRGVAIDMSFSAKAKCVSPFAINRRENELTRMKFLSYATQKAPAFKPMMEATLPIGRTEDEVETIFSNVFVDEVEEKVNQLITFIKDDVKADRLKNQMALYGALSGLFVYKGYEYNGTYNAQAVHPLFFMFDMNAKEPDLKDASYMGENHFFDASTIFERWQHLDDTDRKAIENFSSYQLSNQYFPVYNVLSSLMGWTSNNIPTYEMYWNDTEKRDYGWVKDESDYPMFTLVNHKDSKYADKDLIPPPQEWLNENKERKIGKDRKETIYVDVTRYCTFIPAEIIGIPRKGKVNDIVLEYGVVPYQDKNSFNISEAQYPYKCGTWSYFLGNVSSPIDDIIDTQRLQNRLLSAAESVINNAGGAGPVIEKSAIDESMGEAGTLSAIKNGKPILIDTQGKGVTNAMGTYDNTVKGNVIEMFNIVKELSGSMDEITGVNQALTGQQRGSGQLNGVTDAKIKQGSTLLQPFFNTLKEVLEDAGKDMATVGLKIYADNPRQLAIITGDKGASIIKITRDMRLEDFRMFVKWDTDPNQAIVDTNGLMVQFLQMGLIDQDTFDDLFNRADMMKLAQAVREYGKRRKHAQIIQERKDEKMNELKQQQMQELAGKMEEEKQKMENKERINKLEDHEMKIDAIHQRGFMAIERDKLRNKSKK